MTKAPRKFAAALMLNAVAVLVCSQGCSVNSLTSREAVLTSVVFGASAAGIGAATRGRQTLSSIVPAAGAIGAGVGLLTGAMMFEQRNPGGAIAEPQVVIREAAVRSEEMQQNELEISRLRAQLEDRKWNAGEERAQATLATPVVPAPAAALPYDPVEAEEH